MTDNREVNLSPERAAIVHLLSEGPTEVVFTKKDGTERKMTCTTNSKFIPAPTHITTSDLKKSKNYSSEVKRVFDLDKKEWRSFRWDSLLTAEQVKAYGEDDEPEY